MLIDYTLGQTSIVFRVKIRSSTTGNGLTGLSGSSSGLVIGTIADNEATSTAYTAAGSTIQTIATLGTYAAPSASDCRFAQVDSTNHPGIYEVQLANARFAVSNAKSLMVSITGASGSLDCDVVIPLRAVNPYSANNFATGLNGQTYPTAVPGAANGLLISGLNSGGVTFAGAAASGATPATAGLTITGGAASTTTGGLSAVGFSITGGAGAASTNGAASGFSVAAGGTTTVSGANAVIFTGTGNGSGVSFIGAGTGDGLTATGGATGRGIHGLGGATSGAGMRLEAQGGTSHGLHAMGINGGNGFEIDGGVTGGGLNVVGGVAFAGLAASGATPATPGFKVTGGAASTTSGGVSAAAIAITGGAGAASTNGAAAGWTINAGGTTTVSGNDAAIFTATGNGNGVTFAHAGTGLDINALTTNNLQVDSTYIAQQLVVISTQSQGGTTTSLTLNASETANPQGCQVSIITGTNAGLKGYCPSYNTGTKVAQLICLQTSTGIWPAPFDTTSYYTIDDLMPAVTAGGFVTAVGVRVEKNVALANFPFVIVLSSDHVSGATGKTVTAQRSINSGAFAACANSPTEVGLGVYSINLAATDLNGDTITLAFSATGCDTRLITLVTQSP